MQMDRLEEKKDLAEREDEDRSNITERMKPTEPNSLSGPVNKSGP